MCISGTIQFNSQIWKWMAGSWEQAVEVEGEQKGIKNVEFSKWLQHQEVGLMEHITYDKEALWGELFNEANHILIWVNWTKESQKECFVWGHAVKKGSLWCDFGCHQQVLTLNIRNWCRSNRNFPTMGTRSSEIGWNLVDLQGWRFWSWN